MFWLVILKILVTHSNIFDQYGWNVLYALKGQKHLAQGNTLG